MQALAQLALLYRDHSYFEESEGWLCLPSLLFSSVYYVLSDDLHHAPPPPLPLFLVLSLFPLALFREHLTLTEGIHGSDSEETLSSANDLAILCQV